MNYLSNQNLQYFVDFLLLILLLVGIGLGIQIGPYLYGISILALILWLFLQKKKKEYEKKLQKEMINKLWGKDHKVKRDFLEIEKLHKFILNKEDVYFNIDDITWTDLNMEEVFSKLDHTMSLPGMQYLYHTLRLAIFDKGILKKEVRLLNLY